MDYKSYLGKSLDEIDVPKIGKLNDDDDLYIESFDGSFEICFDAKKVISTIFIYPEFSNELVDGIIHDWGKNQVLERFGTPDAQGEDHVDPVLGKYGTYHKFNYEKYSLHVEYDYEKPSIKLITLQLIEPPKEEELFLYPIPSFVATLLNKEKAKGSPLTEKEVLELRDNAPCVALPISQKVKMDESRGYDDIDMEYAWEQWQEARVELKEED